MVEPGRSFTVADYRVVATRAIEDIAARQRTPVLQGGTGLYVRALLDGWNLAAVPANPALREQLEARLRSDGVPALEAELQRIDPAAAARAQRNPRRLIRSLELHASTGLPPSTLRRATPPPWRVLLLGLEVPFDELDRRIERRVDRMLEEGLLEEVRGLRARYPEVDLAGLGHGYREMGAVLDGTMELPAARTSTIRQVRQYARRQRTWFRADPRVRWIPPDVEPAAALAAAFIGGEGEGFTRPL